MGILQDLRGLNAAYASVQKEAYTVTTADKKGNTPAYQGYKAGKKNVKTGEPMYKAADHLKKEERESQLWDEVAQRLTELHELGGVQFKVVPLNEKLDPVGKEDSDVNNDGKVDSSDSYLKKRRAAIGKAMGKKDTMKKEDVEITSEVEKLIESGLFSGEEIARITNIQEADIADILARLEKKRISKGGNPDDSPLPAMKKYHADKKKKAEKK
tara:strand:+ start:186 stop:824 length:639 start_codon:yes stop_codon:yes gene_type:complete